MDRPHRGGLYASGSADVFVRYDAWHMCCAAVDHYYAMRSNRIEYLLFSFSIDSNAKEIRRATKIYLTSLKFSYLPASYILMQWKVAHPPSSTACRPLRIVHTWIPTSRHFLGTHTRHARVAKKTQKKRKKNAEPNLRWKLLQMDAIRIGIRHYRDWLDDDDGGFDAVGRCVACVRRTTALDGVQIVVYASDLNPPG